MSDDWQELEDGLVRTLVFRDFKEAFRFMTLGAELAEQHNHHPTWTNTYNHVRIALNTHDDGGAITIKDRTLADAFDALLKDFDIR